MELPSEQRWRAWAEIDLEALRHNVAVAKSLAPTSEILAVVKADAYGHGLEEVCRALCGEVSYLGVAALQEAVTIAETLGNDAPNILLLGTSLAEEMTVAIERGWHFSLSSSQELGMAATIAGQLGKVAQIHVAVDTGMGRIGALEVNFQALCEEARNQSAVCAQGLVTHLPSADEDHDFTEKQLSQFAALVERAQTLWEPNHAPQLHVLNSAGVCRFGKCKCSALIRPGLMLYGVAPETQFQNQLKPVMTLKTRVRLVRDLPQGRGISYGRTFITSAPTRVATLGIGYGDGYPRSLSGQGAHVLIQGVRCALLGRVTMDQIMVDVSQLPDPVEPGEEVVVYGCQGDEEISVAEIADKAGTIPWEILTSVTKRVPRAAIR